MVDKIDRPNPPEPWTITATPQTKDRGQRQGQPSPERDDEYSSPGTPTLRWQKFHGQSDTRRIMSVDRNDIHHLWFRKVVIQRQLALVECDMAMRDGTLYHGAQFLLPRLDDYFQFKGYILGQEMPITTVSHDLVTEVSVPLPTAATTTPPATTMPAPLTHSPPPTTTTAWWSLWDATTHQLRPAAMLLYSAVALVIMGIILSLV